ncbi:erythromycin esterase family protein [Aeoliella sp. SH292]|uniref:erythromycin esterase family protein n=1 Tax=Aeoliella sp. SH292 TaxID=3454464 RepID=UPI003F9BEE43
MSSQSNTYPTIETWIAAESFEWSLDDSASIGRAVDALLATLGDSVQVLGWGEPTHQVEGFLQLRNRVFQHLVEHHGYTAIAIESSYPRGRLANDYVQGRGDITLEEAMTSGVSHGFGERQANRELVEWMRAYTADHRERPLRFEGFDAPTEMTYSDSPRQLVEAVLDYLDHASYPSAAELRSRYNELLGDDSAWENQQANFDPTKSIGLSPQAQQLAVEVRNLSEALREQSELLISKTTEELYEAATHDLHLAGQLLTYHAAVATPSDNRLAELLGQRDRMMADNLLYIARSEKRRGGKVFAFAHNSHLKLREAEWRWGDQSLAWLPAGHHVRAIMGTAYQVVGIGAGTLAAYGLAAPEPGTLEALLAGDGNSRFVPTHAGTRVPSEQIESLPTRTADPRYFPFTRESLQDFDAIGVLAEAK